MKRFTATLMALALTAVFCACDTEPVTDGNSDTVSSEITSSDEGSTESGPDFDSTVTFAEDRPAAYAFSNIAARAEHSEIYGFAFYDSEEEATYLNVGAQTVKLTESGREIIDINVRHPYTYNGVLYYLNDSDTEPNGFDLCKYEDGSETVLAIGADHILYGENAIFYVKENTPYRYEISTAQISEMTQLPEGTDILDIIAYRGSIWLPDANMIINETDGSSQEIALGWDQTVGARNGYIYFIKGSDFCRINVDSKKVDTLPALWNGTYPSLLNFTDEYMFYSPDGKDVYRVDSTFADPQKITLPENANYINITANGDIFVSLWDGVCQIDEDGNVISKYE